MEDLFHRWFTAFEPESRLLLPMDLRSLFTLRRFGSDKIPSGPRSGFQRDFDRLIFSSAFRRLQNKTQVFPLPGTAFVHNRLTHSLEVASVGRSLGKMSGEEIAREFRNSDEEVFEFYKYELPNVIAAACLAHDIGNPAFGHSGEKAISAYFRDHASELINGKPLKEFFSEGEWQDLTNFEGNANAIRILTRSLRGRFSGGFGLTYTTIASILKYPCESTAIDKKFSHRKKYGFFQSEKKEIERLAEELGFIQQSQTPLVFCRHPFVYLVEAADDICYTIIDLEDAHRLGLLPTTEVKELLFDLIRKIDPDYENRDRVLQHYNSIEDKNEAIAFLRAKVINILTVEASRVFSSELPAIMEGRFNSTLIDRINERSSALNEIRKISAQKIYGHDTVVQIEIAGFHVMSELLSLFVPSLLNDSPSHKQKKVIELLPFQFAPQEGATPYERIMNSLDHLSGMTDEYATEIYRRLTGIVIPGHK